MKIGRNDPCPCGSGKKYKKCCLNQNKVVPDLLVRRAEKTYDNLMGKLSKHTASVVGEKQMEATLTRLLQQIEVDEQQLDWENNEEFLILWLLFDPLYDPEQFPAPAQSPPGTSVARHFSLNFPDRLDSLEGRLLQLIDAEPESFYEVTRLLPGQGYLADDLLRGGKSTFVPDKENLEEIEPGDIFFGRLILLSGNQGIWPAVSWLIIPPRLKTILLDFRRWLLDKDSPITTATLHDYAPAVRKLFFDIYSAVTRPVELLNSDGEPVLLHAMYYEIDSPARAFEALKSLASGIDEQELMENAELNRKGEIKKVSIPWIPGHQPGQPSYGGDETVWGVVDINGRGMEAHTNSKQRAAVLKVEIEKRLGPNARYLATETVASEKMLDAATLPDDLPEAEDPDLMNDPRVKQQIELMLARHWRSWIDTELPALGHITPRQAVKTESGRQAVEAVLLDIQRSLNDDDPQLKYIADTCRRLKLNRLCPGTQTPLKASRAAAVKELIVQFATTGIDRRYIDLSLKLCTRIAEMESLSIQRGRKQIWAAAICYVIAELNLLFNPENRDHLSRSLLCSFFNTRQSTVAAKARLIRRTCGIVEADPEFCLADV